MDVRSEIRQRIGAYLRGELSLSDLVVDVASFDQEALDAARLGDDRAERLIGTVDLLAAEWTAGHRCEQDVHAELADSVTALPVGPAYVPIGSVDHARSAASASNSRRVQSSRSRTSGPT